jgi:hypothetical protein
MYEHSGRTSQETHYFFSTKTNRLMLFRKAIAVNCENLTKNTNTVCEGMQSFYVTAGASVITGFTVLVKFHSCRKVAGSIPDEIIRFFNLPNLSSRIMSVGLTQLLAEMNARNIPGVG